MEEECDEEDEAQDDDDDDGGNSIHLMGRRTRVVKLIFPSPPNFHQLSPSTFLNKLTEIKGSVMADTPRYFDSSRRPLPP